MQTMSNTYCSSLQSPTPFSFQDFVPVPLFSKVSPYVNSFARLQTFNEVVLDAFTIEF